MDALSVFAELGIALAGFSGIVVALGQSHERLTALERYRLKILLTPSLAAAFLALIALALLTAGLPPDLVWRASGGLLGVVCLGFPAAISSTTRTYLRRVPDLFNLALLTSLLVLYLVFGVAGVLVAAGVAGRLGPAIVQLGLTWLLFSASVQFVRILFVQPETLRERARELEAEAEADPG